MNLSLARRGRHFDSVPTVSADFFLGQSNGLNEVLQPLVFKSRQVEPTTDVFFHHPVFFRFRAGIGRKVRYFLLPLFPHCSSGRQVPLRPRLREKEERASKHERRTGWPHMDLASTDIIEPLDCVFELRSPNNRILAKKKPLSLSRVVLHPR